MDNQKKFFSALRTLKSDVEATIYNDILTEEDFKAVDAIHRECPNLCP